MKNSSKVIALHNDEIILTAKQVELYRDTGLILKTRSGEIVDVIIPGVQKAPLIDAVNDSKNMLHLLECLVVNQNGSLELNETATAGLADVLALVQDRLSETL